MNYKLGNNREIDSVGETTPLTCPNCNKKVKLSVFSNKELRIIPEFPILKNGMVYFLVCPECSSLFGVDEEKGKTFSKGEPLAIGNYDLKELKKYEL